MVQPVSAAEFVYMTHPGIDDATQEVPDEPGVVERQKGLGWVVADRPAPKPFTPVPGDAPADDGWVDLTHKVTGARHTFPSNAEALEGAIEAGWQIPKPPKPAPKSAPESAPSKSTTKASTPPATDETKE
jgi:hypothetical protein